MQVESSLEVQKLKPQVDLIKRRYGEDKERIQRETNALYEKAGVKPLAGPSCATRLVGTCPLLTKCVQGRPVCKYLCRHLPPTACGESADASKTLNSQSCCMLGPALTGVLRAAPKELPCQRMSSRQRCWHASLHIGRLPMSAAIPPLGPVAGASGSLCCWSQV